MATSVAKGSLSSLDDFVWTVRPHPKKTGKSYLCVSTPGNAPPGATLYVPKPSPISPKFSAPVSPKLAPLSPRTNSSPPTSKPAPLPSKNVLNNKIAPSPLSREDTDEPPPPDDDDEDDILYCEVCDDDERHLASHRCMVCEQDICRKKSNLHTTEPAHRLLSLAEIKVQQVARYRALFASPGFDLKKKYVEVLFDDPGALEDGEIPLTKGEFIEVDSEKNETPEWWHGIKVANPAVTGLFPNNYVTTLNLAKIKSFIQSAPRPSSSSMRTAKPTPKPSSSAPSASASMSVARSPPASPTSQPSSSSLSPTASTKKPGELEKKAERCNISVVTIHEFPQTQASYLGFGKGERLTITKKKSDKWWYGMNSRGAKGWVPANHVQLAPEGT